MFLSHSKESMTLVGDFFVVSFLFLFNCVSTRGNTHSLSCKLLHTHTHRDDEGSTDVESALSKVQVCAMIPC